MYFTKLALAQKNISIKISIYEQRCMNTTEKITIVDIYSSRGYYHISITRPRAYQRSIKLLVSMNKVKLDMGWLKQRMDIHSL